MSLESNPLKLAISDDTTISKLLSLGFKAVDNWKLVKKVYCKDNNDDKNFYEINMLTNELFTFIDTKYLDDTIFELINAGVITTVHIN